MTVIIIGAGIGGLTLAQALKRADITFKVFERDDGSDYRAQGYRLRLSSDGIDALEWSLPPDLWQLFHDTCASVKFGMTRIDALSGKIENSGGIRGTPTSAAGQGQPQGPPKGPPAVRPSGSTDRTVLRDILLKGLEGHVVFGKEFSHYTLSSSSIEAYFKDGSTFSGALLIGADGVRSQVRKQLIPKHRILDAGARLLYGKTHLSEDVLQKVDPETMNTMTLIRDDRESKNNLICFLEALRFPKDRSEKQIHEFPLPNDYIYWVLGGNGETIGVPDEELLKLSGEEVARLSVELTRSWKPALRSILELQDPSQTAALRVSTATPDMAVWESCPRVTVMGDAVHVMPPMGGLGANTVLRDAMTLGQIITEKGLDALSVEDINSYEATMREHAAKSLRASWQGRQALGPMELDECKPLNL